MSSDARNTGKKTQNAPPIVRISLPIAFLCCLASGACAVTTEGVRSEPGQRGTIHVAAPYDVVYRRFVARAHGSADGGTNVSYFFVTAAERVPGKSAIVEVVQGGLLRRVMISTDITAAVDGTDVVYYKNSAFAIFIDFDPVIAEWANGTGSRCGLLIE